MHGKRIALYCGLLVIAAALGLSISIQRAEPVPASRSPTRAERVATPARLATEPEQRDILRTVLSNRYPGPPLPPPMPRDPPRGPESLRPIPLMDRSIAFCAPSAKAESLEPDCAVEGIDAEIASSRLESGRADASGIARSFRAALIDANRRAYPQPVPGGRPTITMSTDSLPRTFQMDFWKGFHDRYPGTAGFVQATRAVVSHDARRALIYIEHHCGGLCGSGDLHLLHFGDGQWRLESSYRLWIS